MKKIITNILKIIYMLFIKIVSRVAYKRKAKEKIVFLMSFPKNNETLLEALAKEYRVVVYYTDIQVVNTAQLSRLGITSKSLKTMRGLINAVSDVTRSHKVFCDNYLALLGGIKKKKSSEIYQIWHATGAIKKFGLEDKQFSKRSKLDQRRFQRVYESFDYFIVASEIMGQVFVNSYGARPEQMLYLGFPRTDKLFRYNVTKKNKKIILYSPTYREGQTALLPIDIEKMRAELSSDYHLVVKVHPHVQHLVGNKRNDDFVTWKTDKVTDDWLQEADILITDYSSVSFDFSLIHPKGQLIFFWYDEEIYDEMTGIQENVKEILVDKICYSEEEILLAIKNGDNSDLSTFNNEWNSYNDGKVTNKIMDYLRDNIGGN